MKVLWERPITKASRLLGVDDRAVFFGGAEISAIDLQDAEALVGDTRLPGGSMDGAVLVRPDGLWQLTPRGIFEIDPASGAGPADLPRQGPGLGRRRPAADRSMAAGRLQSHDLGLSAPGCRAPSVSRPTSTPRPRRRRLAMNKSVHRGHLPVAGLSALAVRPGPGPVLRAGMGRPASAEHRGLHRRRQGLRSRPSPNLVEIDLEVVRLLGADRRRDRQVPRRQEADPRRLRRAEARQRHRGGTRPAGRPEGPDAKPLLLRLPAEHADQDRGPALAEARRQGVRHPQDGRGERAAAGRPAARRRPGRRRQGRAGRTI